MVWIYYNSIILLLIEESISYQIIGLVHYTHIHTLYMYEMQCIYSTYESDMNLSTHYLPRPSLFAYILLLLLIHTYSYIDSVYIYGHAWQLYYIHATASSTPAMVYMYVYAATFI